MEALSILFGALLTIVTSLAIGRTVLRRLPVQLFHGEEDALAFVSGAGILSFVLFFLSALHWANTAVFSAVALTAIAAAVYLGSHRNIQTKFEPLPRWWAILFWAGFTIFTALYFFSAMAPEFSPDGTAYHLSFVARYERAHGFVRIPTNIYAQLSQAVELLYLMAFSFGRHSAAALVHYAFLLALVLGIVSYGRRVGQPVAGLAGALLVYASPVVGKDGTSAYIDVAVAAILFTAYYSAQLWDEQRSNGLLVLIGLLAGFGYAAKYTAVLALPYAAGFVLWRTRRVRPALIIVASTLAVATPWVVKNVLWAGNPVAPMLNWLFPNPWVHISFEHSWTEYLRQYALTNRWAIPLEVTVRGEKLGGLLGPVFLLAPLCMAGLRIRAGRRVLAAAALFTIPYAANIGTRFLIPALPFYAFTLGLVLTEMPLILATLLVAHCVLSWPSVAARYADRSPWILGRIPFKQALRIESQDSWLGRKQPDYAIAKLMERAVPPGQRVLSFSSVPESYTKREVWVGFQSASGEVLNDTFRAAFLEDYQPRWSEQFRFSRRELRGLRVVQTGKSVQQAQWTISELRLYSGGKELPRRSAWRLTARPDPWDVQLAFDNSPVTRWKTWQPFEPGMFIQVDFDRPEMVDRVELEDPGDCPAHPERVEGMTPDGRWIPLKSERQINRVYPPPFMGKAAMRELRLRGVSFLFIRETDPGWPEVAEDPSVWGLTEVGAASNGRLFRLDAGYPEFQSDQDGTAISGH